MTGPTRIEIPVPFPIGSVNAWLWTGGRPALVDCGIGTPDGHRILREALWDSGVDAHQARLYLTHGHVDHAGNAGRLRREFGIPLGAPAAEAPFVETFRRDSEARNDAFAEALRMHGMPADDVARVRGRSAGIDAYTDDCPIAEELQPGQRVVLGDVEAVVHHCPGHTPGSVVYEAGDHLLTGDTLLETVTSNAIELLDGDTGRFHTYLRTLESLRRFVGLRVLPGHHGPFTLTDAVIDDHLDRHRRRAHRIVAQLDGPRTAWQVLPRVFPRLQEEQWFLAMSDVVGHLHALERDGRVVRDRTDGVRRFIAV